MRPADGTYPDYYGRYIPLVDAPDVADALENGRVTVTQTLRNTPRDKEDYAYAAGKWTVKQVVQHIIDAERVFAYRALRFARRDPVQPLPFEEDAYAASAELSHRSLADLTEEFEAVRRASQTLFRSFPDTALLRTGQTSFGPTTVVALGFLIAGHALHHHHVLKTRYL